MDLVFDVDNNISSFTVEVGYFDTIQEIKQKVEKYHNIPVHEQTLKFNDKTLPDDLNIHTSDIFHGSHLKLITATTVAADPPPPPQTTKIKTEENKIINIFLRTFGKSIAMDVNDMVLKIKEKVNEMEGIPLSRIVVVHANGIELHDHKCLHECQIADGSEVEITVRPPTPQRNKVITPPPPPPAICGLNIYSKKMKVNVMSKCGEKVSLEVNPGSNVGELRKELEKVRHRVGFGLPEEGYFFIYKQNVMEEDQSFRWHRVGQGDTIEIFNGCVTGGS